MLFLVVNIGAVFGWFGRLLSYFTSVIWGLAIAYLVRPFTRFVSNKLPRSIKSERTRTRISAACALVLLLLVVMLLFLILVPRAFESFSDFLKNFDTNLESLKKLAKDAARSISFIKVEEESIERFIGDSETLLKNAAGWVQTNYEKILVVLTDAANVVVQFVIVITIAGYALFDMDNIKRNAMRLEFALIGKERAGRVNQVLARGDGLMTNFLTSNMIDALIIGVVNFIFLTMMDAPYTLMLSVLLGATNFVPTFGPVVGGVLGGLIIALTDSQLLLGFIIFTIVLQQIDGNVIKPILFGDSTGLSGFWVMVSIVVGGKMFGVLGMILGVPVAAFIGMILNDTLSRRNGDDDLKGPAPGKKKRHFSIFPKPKRRKKDIEN